MRVIHKKISLSTKGNGDLLDITGQVQELLQDAAVKSGTLTVFVIGSTAGITTFEYEPGLIQDMRQLYERFIPQKAHYLHDDTWADANGFSHLRAAFTGPSLTIPFEQGKLLLGTWQQVVLAEFDHRPRKRTVIVQIMGE